jgi:CRISPR/Cas system-associated exonuclease Cas4 (RecB family)
VAEPPGGGSREPDWRTAVSVREDTDLARLLAARLPLAGAPRPVSVTDLLAPRRAYWRAVGPPIAIAPEREVRLEEGRRLHRALGVGLAVSGALEVRVRRDGLQGRIDLLTDRPVEVKTSSSSLPKEDLRTSRPDHVDQLGMYCALLDATRGRLLYLRNEGERVAEVAAYDLEFAAPAEIRAAMEERAGRLREAVASGGPARLPRCPWYGRGCEFQGAAVCDCSGDEPVGEPLAVGRSSAPAERPEIASEIARTVSALRPSSGPPLVERFRDLLYPRRAFFRRSLPAPTPPETTGPARAEPSDLYRRLLEAVEGGPTGEVYRLPTRSEEPDEEVGGYFGQPYLVRTSRARSRVPVGEWLTRAPQYALELGFRCVATGTSSARLIVGYEPAGSGPSDVQVVEIRFQPVSVFSRVWRSRAEGLARALETGDPVELAACPRWMYDACDYREVCGCGSADGRVQWKRTVDATRRNPSAS